MSAYVTFHREEDALKAISAVNNAFIDGRYLKYVNYTCVSNIVIHFK